jgi:hypothetical protein
MSSQIFVVQSITAIIRYNFIIATLHLKSRIAQASTLVPPILIFDITERRNPYG